MTVSNIQQFDEITGRVLGTLYENFPVPKSLRIKQFVEDGFIYDERVQVDVPSESGMFFMACIDWLAEAGYLRFRSKAHNDGFVEAVLTAKGLEVLKAIPESLQTGPSLGDQLVDATKSGAKSLLGSIAGQALSIGVHMASAKLGLSG
ncbi:hypothetical protein [Pseudomonas fontis]|uniref:DUF2513 domain-containing protein n=1 Tax=Pseudomonas fontis TaxID=2942633 RepID=A0ABT5NXL0_9PSED|nr:hypothetical protein [Pseudomonas fontis]MDD0973804.1 hypothetical protein [Pseudomonas fontis]MDD0992938.1 hypothetical protein [Pseudomonas fontis]